MAVIEILKYIARRKHNRFSLVATARSLGPKMTNKVVNMQSQMSVLSAMIFLGAPAISLAQGAGSGRAESWEFSAGAIYQDSESASGTGGSSFSMDSELGFAFNVGYNLTDKLALSADFDFIRPDYTAVIANENDPNDTINVNHTLSQFNGRFKGTFNFLEGPFSPFVEVGAGWTYFDSNVASGPPITGCYWHPYWGYICANYYDTFSGTEVTYGGAVGFRYDIAGGGFIKAGYSVYEVDLGGDASNPQLSTVRLEYGWRF